QYVLLPSARGGYKRRYVHELAKAAPATTTERPLVRVWNSFVRSVRPAISFRNLTNPLANFFNDGAANIIETSPVVLQSYDDGQELPFEDPLSVPAESSTKRKRRRRKQQKRKHAYDTEEYGDPYNPYDPYFTQSPPLAPEQPMFFYDTNSGSYYGVQRYSPQDFYNNFHSQEQQTLETGTEMETQPEDLPVLRKLSTRKVTLLRPLPLSSAKGQSPAKLTEAAEPEPEPEPEPEQEAEPTNDSEDATAASEAENVSGGSSALSDATTTDDDIDTNEPLSESMRNALGTYMRDDRHTRQRQRQPTGKMASGGRVSPRHHRHHRRFIRLGAW
ncbi:hypothetical protein KR018_001018, partial [Drosophila ironensis]